MSRERFKDFPSYTDQECCFVGGMSMILEPGPGCFVFSEFSNFSTYADALTFSWVNNNKAHSGLLRQPSQSIILLLWFSYGNIDYCTNSFFMHFGRKSQLNTGERSSARIIHYARNPCRWVHLFSKRVPEGSANPIDSVVFFSKQDFTHQGLTFNSSPSCFYPLHTGIPGVHYTSGSRDF